MHSCGRDEVSLKNFGKICNLYKAFCHTTPLPGLNCSAAQAARRRFQMGPRCTLAISSSVTVNSHRLSRSAWCTCLNSIPFTLLTPRATFFRDARRSSGLTAPSFPIGPYQCLGEGREIRIGRALVPYHEHIQQL